jgi:hypothetical protein
MVESGAGMTVSRLMSVVLSVVYSLAQIAQGLLVHPYRTMQSLVRERVFFVLTFLPVLVWVFAKLLWSLVIVPVVRLVFSCSASGFVGCEFIPFLTNWLLYFCILWQMMLVYLLVRFEYAFSEKSS